MTREEIIAGVKDYIRDPKAQYAVLIDSPWGSGKTYLYKNYILPAIEAMTEPPVEEKINIYISLYGISSIDALAKQLMTNFLITIQNKKANVAKRTLQETGGLLAIASKAVSVSIKDVINVDLSKISSLKELGRVKDIVLCFDDLERCTIPVNEVLGFVDNVIEHCGCKVIVLADEENIGKIYANSNVELKYLSLLMGGRKLVEQREDMPLEDDEITIEQLKKLNESVYSVNYFYKDIREKVIGKTLPYYPSLRETILEILNGNPEINTTGYVRENDYRAFLNAHIDRIEKSFLETDNRNLRIFLRWIDKYKMIYKKTEENYRTSPFHKQITDSFLQYSIWLSGSIGQNKKLVPWNSGFNVDYIVFEGNEDEPIIRHRFIDEWMKKTYWDDKAFGQSVKQVESVESQNSLKSKKKESTGKALGDLRDWRFKQDDEVARLINKLRNELKDGKYAFGDFQKIIDTLLLMKKMKLYNGDLMETQKVMLGLIDKSTECEEIVKMPRTFVSEDDRKAYMEVYGPVEARIDERVKELNLASAVDTNKYETAKIFLESCEEKKSYYIEHKSFTEFISIDRVVELLKKSSLEGIYSIKQGFATVYDMGSINAFYMNDISELRRLKEMLLNREFFPIEGRTREIAIESFVELLNQVLGYIGA